jgi:hypothetical protein
MRNQIQHNENTPTPKPAHTAPLLEAQSGDISHMLENNLPTNDRKTILNRLKDEFVSKYRIEIPEGGSVKLELPGGIDKSRRDFIQEAEEIAKELYGVRFIGRYYTHGTKEDYLFGSFKFTCPITKDHDVELHLIKSREAMCWSRMNEGEKTNVPFRDIAVGFVAYYMATGKPLFVGGVFTMEAPIYTHFHEGTDDHCGLGVSDHTNGNVRYGKYHCDRIRSSKPPRRMLLNEPPGK